MLAGSVRFAGGEEFVDSLIKRLAAYQKRVLTEPAPPGAEGRDKGGGSG